MKLETYFSKFVQNHQLSKSGKSTQIQNSFIKGQISMMKINDNS